MWLPWREWVAEAAAFWKFGADIVWAWESARGDGLVGGGAAEDVDVPAGLVAYPQRIGSHAGYVMRK